MCKKMVSLRYNGPQVGKFSYFGTHSLLGRNLQPPAHEAAIPLSGHPMIITCTNDYDLNTFKTITRNEIIIK